MSTYLEQLKDPRWQRKRLEILNRDEWTCVECGATDKNLQVDHMKYAPSGRPWEVGDDDLQTLCDGCHQEATQLRRSLREIINRHGPGLLRGFAGYLEFHTSVSADDDRLSDAGYAFGVAHALGLPGEVVPILSSSTGGITVARLIRVSALFRRAGCAQLLEQIVEAL